MSKYTFFSVFLSLIFFACNPPKQEEKRQEVPEQVEQKFTYSENDKTVKGEILFKQQCSSCHSVTGMLVGPPLQNIGKRYANDKKWLYAYIRDNQTMIQKGDAKAVALYNLYDKTQMPRFTFLKEEEIEAILAYLDLELIP